MDSTTKQSKRAIGWTLSPENKAKIPEWNKRWEKQILSTDPINFEKTKAAVAGMYEAAGLVMPPRVVRVRSTIEGAIVCVWAATFWQIQNKDSATDIATNSATANATHIATANATNRATHIATANATNSATHSATANATNSATANATNRATNDATNSATHIATDVATANATNRATDSATHIATANATNDATANATNSATDIATHIATNSATANATNRATNDATRGATNSATNSATANATNDAQEGSGNANQMYAAARAVVLAKLPKQSHALAEAVAKKLLGNWYTFYNGGSEWSAWACYLTFVRDVVGFKCPEHEKYKHYENALVYGGPRFMHKKFVLLCDRTKERRTEIVNGIHRLHYETGPAIRWGCGTKRWAVHGVIVDEQIVMRPETQTIKQIEAEKNEEVRRIRIERFGWVRYLKESGAKVIDRRQNEIDQQHECLLRDPRGVQRLVVADPSTARVYALGVPRDVKTCEQAQAWLNHGLQITHRS